MTSPERTVNVLWVVRVSEGRFQSQSHFCSQTFLKSQTHLLKDLLRDKGGIAVAGCREAVIRRWLGDQEAVAVELDKESQALVQVYESLLAEPRPFNLRRIKPRGKASQLQWRVPNESGSQIVVSLFDAEREDSRDALARLPQPLITALFEIESWRVTLNWMAALQHSARAATNDCLEQISKLQLLRRSCIATMEPSDQPVPGGTGLT